jgi:hypothetical protein
LSLNYFQACIFTTVFTYFTMAAIIGLIVVNVIGVSESLRSKIHLVLYLIIFAWYMGIIIDLYVTFKN